MELVYSNFNLNDVIDESVSILSTKIKEKNLSISKEIEDNIHLLLYGDSTRIRQIFVNLISNAVKFTEKGGIKISVKTLASDDKSITLSCAVVDTGIGIPKDKINTLFKPFSQVDSSQTRNYGGTGLGLVICKEFISMMNGEIGVQSEVNKGSRFFFTIKLALQTAASNDSSNNILSKIYDLKEETVESASEMANLKSKREEYKILLAEDNFVNQKVCLRILNEAGFKADAVVNGLKAIEAVKKHSYNLILMDVQMPECDGFTATKEIRKLGASYEKLPIIAITAHALKGDKEKCIEAGMNDYISKPIISDNLIRMMDKWLNVNAVSNNLSIKKSNYIMEDIFDFDHLEKMSIGDLEFQKDLITTYIDDVNKRFDLLESYLNQGNLDKLVNEAHTIKGSSLSVGANLVGREALEVEMTREAERPFSYTW